MCAEARGLARARRDSPPGGSHIDDLGLAVEIASSVSSVVSLVPSLTESIAVSAPGLLVGATDWCTHPADLEVARIRGTKNPDVAAIIALRPDLVVANQEENRVEDLDALRVAGLAVWVTNPRTVAESLVSLDRMLSVACGLDRPEWLSEAMAAWGGPAAALIPTALIPIWRRPWMAIGSDTFAGDLLLQLGVRNVLADDPERYPKISLDDIKGSVDLVILPDEPYAFSEQDGPEAFADWAVPVACVSGRHLTWYGPSLLDAATVLRAQLDRMGYS